MNSHMMRTYADYKVQKAEMRDVSTFVNMQACYFTIYPFSMNAFFVIDLFLYPRILLLVRIPPQGYINVHSRPYMALSTLFRT